MTIQSIDYSDILVVTWNHSSSALEASHRMGLSWEELQLDIEYYRESGVLLKPMSDEESLTENCACCHEGREAAPVYGGVNPTYQD